MGLAHGTGARSGPESGNPGTGASRLGSLCDRGPRPPHLQREALRGPLPSAALKEGCLVWSHESGLSTQGELDSNPASAVSDPGPAAEPLSLFPLTARGRGRVGAGVMGAKALRFPDQRATALAWGHALLSLQASYDHIQGTPDVEEGGAPPRGTRRAGHPARKGRL